MHLDKKKIDLTSQVPSDQDESHKQSGGDENRRGDAIGQEGPRPERVLPRQHFLKHGRLDSQKVEEAGRDADEIRLNDRVEAVDDRESALVKHPAQGGE